MASNFKDSLNNIFSKFVIKDVSLRSAFGLSFTLHVLLAVVFGTFYVGSQNFSKTKPADEIVFDLETIKSSISSGIYPEQEYGVSNPEATQESGRAGNLVKGNQNRDAVLAASLSSLSELRESFNFISQNVAADSIGGFSPTDGQMPGSEYNSFGRKKGEDIGRGSKVKITTGGGGSCPGPTILP